MKLKTYLMSTVAPCYYSVFNTTEQKHQIKQMQVWCAVALHRFKQKMSGMKK